MSRILFVVLLSILSGCVTPNTTKVDVHNTSITTWVAVHNNKLQDIGTDKSYSIVPYGGQERSSDFKQYESIVKQVLAKHGFVYTLPGDAAWKIVISYGVTYGINYPSAPSMYRMHASRERYNPNPNVSRTSYLATACKNRASTLPNSNRVIGTSGGASSADESAYEWYKHFLNIQISKAEGSAKDNSRTEYYEPRMGYSVSAYNYDAGYRLPVVMPALIEAVFIDFPNQTSSHQTTMRCIN